MNKGGRRDTNYRGRDPEANEENEAWEAIRHRSMAPRSWLTRIGVGRDSLGLLHSNRHAHHQARLGHRHPNFDPKRTSARRHKLEVVGLAHADLFSCAA